jgi:hypothetical protein
MSKRRRNKKSYERYRDDEPEDDDQKEVKKKSRKKTRSREPGKKGDMALFGALIVIILVIVVGYFAYTVYFVEDEDEGDGFENPPRREIMLQVISDSSHNFGDSSTHDSDIGGKTDFLLLVANNGEATDTVSMKSSGGATGMTLSFDKTQLAVKKDGTQVVIATVSTSQTGFGSFSITATSDDDAIAKDTVTVNVNAKDLNDRQAQYGDKVDVYYVLVDRGTDAAFNPDKWAYNQDGPFTDFVIGQDVIEGFAEMADGMKVGETHVAIIPADKAYGNNPGDTRPDGDLVYEMQMMEIK